MGIEDGDADAIAIGQGFPVGSAGGHCRSLLHQGANGHQGDALGIQFLRPVGHGLHRYGQGAHNTNGTALFHGLAFKAGKR